MTNAKELSFDGMIVPIHEGKCGEVVEIENDLTPQQGLVSGDDKEWRRLGDEGTANIDASIGGRGVNNPLQGCWHLLHHY